MTDFDVRDEREPGHFWADNEVYDHFGSRIGPTGLAVYMGLCRYSKAGVSFPSIGRLAKDLGIKSEQTIRKALGVLKDVGLIRIEERPADPNARRATQTHRFYILKVAKDKRDVEVAQGEGANNVPPPANNVPRGVQNITPNKTYIEQDLQNNSGGVERPRQDAAAITETQKFLMTHGGLTLNQARTATRLQDFTQETLDRIKAWADKIRAANKKPGAILCGWTDAGLLPDDLPPPKVADWKPRRADGSIDYDRWNALIAQDRRWRIGPVS